MIIGASLGILNLKKNAENSLNRYQI